MKIFKYSIIVIISIGIGMTLIVGAPEMIRGFDSLKNKAEQFVYDTQTYIKNDKGETVHLPEPLRVIKEELDKKEKESPLTVSGIIIATNEERIKESLPPLTENTLLNTSAQMKAQDMLTLQYFEHESPNGHGVSDLATDAGYEYIVIGENLALGNFSDSTDVVTAWMNSPGHRANIVNTRYTDIGIGVVQGMYEGKKVWLAVQHFGLPKDFCPPIDSSLKQLIETDTETSKELEASLTVEKQSLESGKYKGNEYNTHIDIYNALVKQYNVLQDRIKTNIEVYNKQINTFNTCAEL